MKLTLSSLALVAASTLATHAAPANLENVSQAAYQEDAGAQDRIALAGQLRMLSQKIAASACFVPVITGSDAAREDLASATAAFGTILDALEFGNADLNILGAEERRKTLAKIEDVRDAWTPMKAAAEAVSSGDPVSANLQVLFDGNMALLETAAVLASEVSGQYSNPADMVQADSFLINIAGRQSMLTQEMAKDACMISTGFGSAATTDSLNTSVATFSSALEALRHGMPSAGIRKPPTAEISQGLDGVQAEWTAAKPGLEAVLTGGTLDSDAALKEFTALNTIMFDMNEIVGMYTEAAKSDL